MANLATILARGGSKGVPGKNIRPICGKPLIQHTIEHARASGVFDAVAVSSDSDEILSVAKDVGVDVLVERPNEMATDQAGKIPAIRHCAAVAEQELGKTFDYVVDLAVTSPLRAPEDIVGAMQMIEGGDFETVYSAQASHASPYFSMVELKADGTAELSKTPDKPFQCRQDVPQCFDLNGAVFIWSRAALFNDERPLIGPKTGIFEMPHERSVDIDQSLDFEIAEFLLSRREQGAK